MARRRDAEGQCEGLRRPYTTRIQCARHRSPFIKLTVKRPYLTASPCPFAASQPVIVDKSVIEVVSTDPQLTALNDALTKAVDAGLLDLSALPATITLFAPINDAFCRLGEAVQARP